ncbi:MAG: T9SS type A sorting domain-containing protein [Bacteroidia bacterium]|nr:T9SS type A sorting domain-containing protein [Bacteroidia bacterium]
MKIWAFLLTFLLSVTFVKATQFSGSEPLGPGYGTSVTFISDLKVYPNPTSNGIFTLEFNFNNEEEITVRIYNLIGKEVLSEKTTSSSGVYDKTVNLSDYPKGIYIVEISNGSQKQTKRVSYI